MGRAGRALVEAEYSASRNVPRILEIMKRAVDHAGGGTAFAAQRAAPEARSMKRIRMCIPTYKRPDFLGRCLGLISDQTDSLPVEVFVADDSCSDVNAR